MELELKRQHKKRKLTSKNCKNAGIVFKTTLVIGIK